jgi:protein SCO1/2
MTRHAMTHHLRAPARLIAALLLSLSLPLALTACGPGGTSAASSERPPLEGATIGGPFTLIDKDGKTVTWNDFNGKYRIVYFGYTFCPDACPLDMQELMKGFAQFEKASPERAAKVQPIFITIDPERDTPKVIGQWTAAFSPRLLGLTGTPQQVAAAAKAFAAYYAKGKETSGGYLMDHSRTAFLMDPDGKPIAILLPIEPGGPGVAAMLEKWVK